MFITIEGTEGAGKSLLIQNLKNKFEKNGKELLITREPGGSILGAKLRPLLLSEKEEKVCPRAELFLFLADRAEHVEKIIKPALEANKIVICDRYVHSTLAYQGYARGLDLNLLKEFNAFATDNLNPDLAFLLDLEVEIGLARAKSRNKDTQNDEGKFEALEKDFHQKVRNGFLEMAKIYPFFRTLDATQSPDIVAEKAWDEVSKLKYVR